jgi:hypothetical protein
MNAGNEKGMDIPPNLELNFFRRYIEQAVGIQH